MQIFSLRKSERRETVLDRMFTAEALEEARAGRPMEWYWGEMTSTKGLGDPIGGVHIYMKEGHKEGCKPEGIAVEMADCAIRILDYLGSTEWDIEKTISDGMGRYTIH